MFVPITVALAFLLLIAIILDTYYSHTEKEGGKKS